MQTEQSGLHHWIEESWAELELLERQRRLCQIAIETASDEAQRARNWQMLARVEEQLHALDERLSAVVHW